MQIGKLMDRINKEESLYYIIENLSRKARQLQDKANPVVSVLEEELVERGKQTGTEIQAEK